MYNKLVLIGRPNVGKSSIFNLFSLVNKSIVLSHFGTTRNFVESEASFLDMNFTIVDTPGYESLYFYENIKSRYLHYIADEKSLLLFVVDEFSSINLEILDILRKYMYKVILLINKIDLAKNKNYHEFYQLGIQDIIPFSATNKIGLDILFKLLKEKTLSDDFNSVSSLPLVSIIGKPNVGKSTLINSIIENEILITGPEAGLTTDSIKVNVDNKFILIDTAGIRRRSLIKDYDEQLFVKHSLSSLRKSDIVCIMVDAFESITLQDVRLINIAYDEGKGVILIINKCDLIDINLKKEQIYEKYKVLRKCSIFFISAIDLRKTFKDKFYQDILRIYYKIHERITTSKLNKWIDVYLRDLKVANGKKIIKYGAHVTIKPSIIVLYYSNKQAETPGYKNFILNSFYKYFDFYGIGVKIQLKKTKNPFL